ncbi:hypothetical protein EVAR_77755_1 [Eumeta japonica]|uniref:Uncharacterized protein n=1 Tax=Eumeta variegata TaxID=151549 RepID=A0A4C1TBT6_EUMVA|nr:hypothetical protein EVAR_77755_1 [Eumeta japonica]
MKKNLAVSLHLVAVYNASSDTVLDFDAGHVLDSNPEPTLDLDSGPVLNFGPGPSSRFCYLSRFHFRYRLPFEFPLTQKSSQKNRSGSGEGHQRAAAGFGRIGTCARCAQRATVRTSHGSSQSLTEHIQKTGMRCETSDARCKSCSTSRGGSSTAAGPVARTSAAGGPSSVCNTPHHIGLLIRNDWLTELHSASFGFTMRM